MIGTTTTSVYRLARGEVAEQPVMSWSCPVPYFGRLGESSVATLGINPSNREFVDFAGDELDGEARRFPTLRSLELRSWEDASSLDLAAILAACDEYFSGNPYQRWFDILDALGRPLGVSYYSRENPMAHLDLVPYATHEKWGALRFDQRKVLLRSGRDLLASLLRDSNVELLVLNGASVVRQFEEVAGVALEREYMPEWDLPRRASTPVRGVSSTGSVERIGDVELGRSIKVAGFNHNLQSSFGVTRKSVSAIAEWMSSR